MVGTCRCLSVGSEVCSSVVGRSSQFDCGTQFADVGLEQLRCWVGFVGLQMAAICSCSTVARC
jgi:hypothetical protein